MVSPTYGHPIDPGGSGRLLFLLPPDDDEDDDRRRTAHAMTTRGTSKQRKRMKAAICLVCSIEAKACSVLLVDWKGGGEAKEEDGWVVVPGCGGKCEGGGRYL